MFHRRTKLSTTTIIAFGIAAGVISVLTADRAGSARAADTVELLNVSYDPTRELLRDVGTAFSARFAKESGTVVTVKQSHGGSGRKPGRDRRARSGHRYARALAGHRRHPQGRPDREGWEQRFPNNAVPWRSTIVFVVRKVTRRGSRTGRISSSRTWRSSHQTEDLGKRQAELPRRVGLRDCARRIRAGGPRLRHEGVQANARARSGARGATVTFAQKKIGDVHLTWENEARLEIQESKGPWKSSTRRSASSPIPGGRRGCQRAAPRHARRGRSLRELPVHDEGQQIIAKHSSGR